jgi:hypothetical protein
MIAPMKSTSIVTTQPDKKPPTKAIATRITILLKAMRMPKKLRDILKIQ